MTSESTAIHDKQQIRRKVLLLCVLLIALACAVVLLLQDHADILAKVQQGEGPNEGEIDGFKSAIDAVQGPANVTVGALGGLGVAAGCALIAVGSPRGMKTAGASAGALAALLLGNGLIK